MKMYMVGGYVRDKMLGVESKDIDYTVVMEDKEIAFAKANDLTLFETMSHELEHMGFEIFLETPQYLTIRARFPKGHKHSGTTADFVLARKEGKYTDGRRPDKVEPGTLRDDLARRDFTINAMALDENGKLIDPYDGKGDLERRMIRCVGNPDDRIAEDALRALRALRFSVTKDMRIQSELRDVLLSNLCAFLVEHTISDERISAEVSKMLRHDPIKTMDKLSQYTALRSAIFAGKVSLDTTMKTKG